MKIYNFLKVQLFVYFYLFVYFSLETTLLRAAGHLENFPSCRLLIYNCPLDSVSTVVAAPFLQVSIGGIHNPEFPALGTHQP